MVPWGVWIVTTRDELAKSKALVDRQAQEILRLHQEAEEVAAFRRLFGFTKPGCIPIPNYVTRAQVGRMMNIPRGSIYYFTGPGQPMATECFWGTPVVSMAKVIGFLNAHPELEKKEKL
jgi:hypothetical protein